MLSRGVDVGSFGNSHFPGVFHYIFISKCLFSPIQGIPSFFEISRITAFFNMKFELLYENFTRSRDCDITFKMEFNCELSEE